MSNKKRIILTLLIILPIVLTAGLLIAAAVTEIFALSVIAHIIIKAALAAICLSLIYKAFKDQIKAHMKHALLVCGAALLVDMVVLSTIRYILSGGSADHSLFPRVYPPVLHSSHLLCLRGLRGAKELKEMGVYHRHPPNVGCCRF